MPQPSIATREAARVALDSQIADLRYALHLMQEPNASAALNALWDAFPALAATDRTGS